MGKLERVYRRTESGRNAWLSEDPQLSPEDRRILGLIEGEMHWDVLRTLLRRHADYLRLAELEAAGLVESHAALPQHDLDFTGSFAFARTA
jgi:hypothetical protein